MVVKKSASTNGGPAADDDTGDVLELGALNKPPRLVSIEGELHEMVNVDALGIGPRERINKLVNRLKVLEDKGERVTAKEEAEYDGRLLEIAKIILPDAPAALMGKLSIGARQALTIDFLADSVIESPRMQTLARARSAGSRLSPGSNGSTAEARPTGTNGRHPS